MGKISPCLWFDWNAEEAAKFYKGVFKKVKVGKGARYGKTSAAIAGQKAGGVMAVPISVEGLDILLLNAGPMFKFTPACSFFVACKTEKEIDGIWKKLSAGGTVRMGLDKYPWAEKYGWVADKFGVNWQLMIQPSAKVKVAPDILFVDNLAGRAKDAIKLYTKIFPKSKIEYVAKNPESGLIDFSSIKLAGQAFHVHEGGGTHGWAPNEAFSFMISCKTQKEVDHYWSALTRAGGEPGPCGWLKDKFGVSWQVVSSRMAEWHKNPEKSDKMMAALVKMKKPNLAKLAAAANS